jgi:asparagine synthase (glutamine-hydrolysing)
LRVSGAAKTLELLAAPQGRDQPLLLAAYQTSQMHFPCWVRDRMLDEDSAAGSADPWYGLPPEFLSFVEELDGAGDRASQISVLALALFLTERCLRDIDSMSMGVSLEVRAPFTDHLFVETAWRLPGRQRCAGPPNKPYEWELVQPYLGKDYPYRRKQGFIFPFEDWLRSSRFVDTLRATLLDQGLATRIGLKPDGVGAVADAFFQPASRVPWSRIWGLYALFQWCERNRVFL